VQVLGPQAGGLVEPEVRSLKGAIVVSTYVGWRVRLGNVIATIPFPVAQSFVIVKSKS
jgi:hypothetical protein